MGKTWTTRRRGDEKDFLRWLAKGKTVYVITDHRREPAAALFDHARTYNSYTCTGKHLLTGGWQMTDTIVNGKGISHTDATTLFRWAGEISDTPPRGIPHVSDPPPRVAGPLPTGEEFDRRLDRDEIRHMQKRAREASDQYDEDRKAGRRGRWF